MNFLLSLGAAALIRIVPIAQIAYETLEASGSPAKQRLIGEAAAPCASAALDFLNRQQAADEVRAHLHGALVGPDKTACLFA